MKSHLKSKAKLPMFRSAIGIGIKLQCAAQRGVDLNDILDGTGIKASELDDPETFITATQELSLLRKMLECIDDPQFGLYVGWHYNAAILGKWAIAAMHSATVLEAFEVAMRYSEISVTFFQFELMTQGEKAFLKMYELVDLGKCRRFKHECQIQAIYLLCKEILGIPMVLNEIRFAFAKPEYADVYQEIFQCPISFNSDVTTLVFDSNYLSLTLPRANHLTRKLYEKECEQLLQSLVALETTKDMVQRVLLSRNDAFPNLEYVAKKLHMSSRTLRRHLKTEEKTFKNIAEEVRRLKAIDLLKTTGQTLEKIAEQLGYSDVPNFCHAFRRWTGRTPSSYREKE